ncbi:histone-fold-containing protein [Cladochytrium replicatum]|nr:histone-fold-containing protein [Cladochytrium replicatum]
MKKKYKTKFPVARIKKIMRLDEDVGKVSQVTPVLISKALELFMQSLIDETCKETRTKGAKKLSPQHLKKTILNTEKFDFLKDVVADIPDMDTTETQEDDDPSQGTSSSGRARGRGGRGRGSGRGRKKKETADE